VIDAVIHLPVGEYINLFASCLLEDRHDTEMITVFQVWAVRGEERVSLWLQDEVSRGGWVILV
jgi:hypothetical protein